MRDMGGSKHSWFWTWFARTMIRANLGIPGAMTADRADGADPGRMLPCSLPPCYKRHMPLFPAPRCSPLARRRAKAYPLSRIDGGEETLQLLGSLRFATGIQLQRALFARTSATER